MLSHPGSIYINRQNRPEFSLCDILKVLKSRFVMLGNPMQTEEILSRKRARHNGRPYIGDGFLGFIRRNPLVQQPTPHPARYRNKGSIQVPPHPASRPFYHRQDRCKPPHRTRRPQQYRCPLLRPRNWGTSGVAGCRPAGGTPGRNHRRPRSSPADAWTRRWGSLRLRVAAHLLPDSSCSELPKTTA